MLRQSNFVVWSAVIGVILIWGITFVNTRALLEDFSALEILVGRFGLALSVVRMGTKRWRDYKGTTRGYGILLAKR